MLDATATRGAVPAGQEATRFNLHRYDGKRVLGVDTGFSVDNCAVGTPGQGRKKHHDI
jgi:hypothetical protein